MKVRWVLINLTTGETLFIQNPISAGEQTKLWVMSGYDFDVKCQEFKGNGVWF